MLCALAAARPDLRRHALWMALAALPFFFAAPLICALAALGGREAALAVETSSALAGAAALPLWPPPLPAALFSRRRCAPCGSLSTSAASCRLP